MQPTATGMETPKTSTDAQHVRQVADQRATAEGRRYMWLHRKKHDIVVEIQKLKIRGTALASAGGRKRERDLKPKTNGEPTMRARKRRGGREEKPTVPVCMYIYIYIYMREREREREKYSIH